MCFVYLEKMIWKWEMGLLGAAWWTEYDLMAYCNMNMGQCQAVHGIPCTFSLAYYAEEFEL